MKRELIYRECGMIRIHANGRATCSRHRLAPIEPQVEHAGNDRSAWIAAAVLI
jgi:hypothetical protein